MRILYLSHTDWAWAKQRPQALAEALADIGHEVDVRYRPLLRRSLASEPPAADAVSSVAVWPTLLPIRSAPVGGIKLAPARSQTHRLVRSLKPDLIWLTSPELWPIARNQGDVPTVFDCMDLTSKLPGRGIAWQSRVRKLEADAVANASITLASSSHIANALGSDSHTLHTVRNGFEPELSWKQRSGGDPLHLAYFGTIGEWFDFDLVSSILAALPAARLSLWGPAAIPIPAHDRITYYGPVPHKTLPTVLRSVGSLIMPFVVDDLILGVDPVKLYEYVATGLPAFAPRYPEITRFEPYVGLYRSADEAVSMIRASTELQGPTMRSRDEFLRANTWHARAMQVDSILREALRPSTTHEGL